MERVIWHYFCRNAKPNEDKYIKYLLISLDSLINIGGVDPENIFISLDIPENFTHKCLDKIYGYNVNILKAPIFKNHSKITNLRRIILEHRTADKIVQIDVDTLITDKNIISKILELEGFLNITTIGWQIYQAIKDRDGLRHPTFSAEHVAGTSRDHSRNLLFSVANEDGGKYCQIHRAERYAAFKHFMDIVFGFDIDSAIETLKEEKRMMVGYLVVLDPKMITDDYLKFISTLDLFFSCDETIWSLAKVYSGIDFSNINKKDKIVHGAIDIHDFDKLKGIIHFPVKDEEIIDPINKMIDQILQK